MTTHSTRRTVAKLLAPLVVFGLVAAACGSDDDSGDDGAESSSATTEASGSDTTEASGSDTTDASGSDTTDAAVPDGPTIRLRGQDFSEAITIAEVYGQYLQAQGYDVEILTPAGFRTEAIDGLSNGDLDLIVDYIGGSQAALAPDAPPSADPDEIVAVIGPAYEEIGATLLDYSPAVDGDAFVVRGDSEATTISDVAGLDYVLGASSQCPERPQCLIGLEDPDIYGIEFADFVTLEFGPLLGEALANDEVDAVIWNTTAPQITEQGFKVLEDDQGLFPAQNIAPIITTEVLEAYGDQLAADLDELSAMITTEDLLAWNTETDIEFRESDEVATEWLQSKGLL
jgi:osmoprotectant transport system substrate-binding protein